MKNCDNCGALIRTDDKYCRNCGILIKSNFYVLLYNIFEIIIIFGIIFFVLLFISSYFLE